MRAFLPLLCGIVACGAAEVFAAHHVGFESDASVIFFRAFEKMESRAFSPVSFELDSVLLAESLDTIPRANMSETMGVLVDFESVYQPLMEGLAERTNGFEFVAARAFLVPEARRASPVLRQRLQTEYDAEVCTAFPKTGAEAWLHAAMDGRMDDFEIPVHISTAERYSFYDLVDLRLQWERPFSKSRTVEMAFYRDDGTTNRVDYMCDTRKADVYKTRDTYFLRLPLRGGCEFFALIPRGKTKLRETLGDLGSLEIDRMLTVHKSITDLNVTHGLVELAIPKLEMTCSNNLMPVMRAFRFPIKGLRRLAGDASASVCEQVLHFRLDEGTQAPQRARTADEGGAGAGNPIKLVFDRPFAFFIYHQGTGSIPLFGLYNGR